MTWDLDTFLRILSTGLSVGAIVWTWFATRRKDVDRRFDVGSKRMDAHDLRLQALEQTVGTMPTREDVHEISLALVRMEGHLEKQAVVLEGNGQLMARLELIVRRHEEHLLDGARR